MNCTCRCEGFGNVRRPRRIVRRRREGFGQCKPKGDTTVCKTDFDCVGGGDAGCQCITDVSPGAGYCVDRFSNVRRPRRLVRREGFGDNCYTTSPGGVQKQRWLCNG